MQLKNLAPYIILAHIYWLDDSGAVPHVVLKNSDKSLFPPGFTDRDSVMFNVSEEAVTKFSLDENGISFCARFSGREFTVYAPLSCILALASKDGGVNIPVNQQAVTQGETLVQESKQEQEVLKEKFKLALIEGGSHGDFKPKGNLTLVKS